MKVLLIGAGGQGAPCASILARDKDITEIVLADINLNSAGQVADKIKSSKLSVLKLNAADPVETANAASGKDVVLDLTATDFTLPIMKGALQAGVHYVNSAYGREMWDFDLQVGKRPKLYQEFQDAGLTALLGCGMSAGYTNVIVRYYADQLDVMTSVKIRLAKKDTSLNEDDEILTPWNPGWSPKTAFMDFVNSTTIFENGTYKTYEQPFSKIEKWKFPEPVGEMTVTLHAHEEAYSMPISFADKGLQHCDFKYYVNKQVAPLVALGFGRVPEVRVDGQAVNPLSVLLALVPTPGDAFLQEDPKAFSYLDETKHVSIMIEIQGEKDGEKKNWLITVPDMNKPRKKLYELFGTTSVNVALPAVIGMKMAVEGTKKGVIFAEELDPCRFITLLRETGYPHRWGILEK